MTTSTSYFRATNETVEASLNGPRHLHLRRLRPDDVRRHRAGDHTLRVVPAHSQSRADVALRIDADAHAGQRDAAALVAFLDERFFRPAGRSMHAEPSDRGHAGYFVVDLRRLPWRGTSACRDGRTATEDDDGLGPRGDGTYVRRASVYNRFFDEVEDALRRIARHHGFAATVELNGRFSIVRRDPPRRVELAGDGAIYDAETWDVIRPGRLETSCDDGPAAGREFPADRPAPPIFKRTWPAEMPGRARLVRRGSTFRAPRCPASGDVGRLEAARVPESTLHSILAYARSLPSCGAAGAWPPRGGVLLTSGDEVVDERPPRPRGRYLRVRRRRPGVSRDADASNPFEARFAAVRAVAIAGGHLGSVPGFDALPEHVRSSLVDAARAGGVPGTDLQYRADFDKLFRTYSPPDGPADPRALWARDADFRRAEQILRSKVGRPRLERMADARSKRGRRKVRGRVDYGPLAIALVGYVLNANKPGVRGDGRRSLRDHCPSIAIRNWMAYHGHGVNGAWVAEATRLLIAIGELRCLTRKYVVGRFARRYAAAGASRRLPFVARLDLAERARSSRPGAVPVDGPSSNDVVSATRSRPPGRGTYAEGMRGAEVGAGGPLAPWEPPLDVNAVLAACKAQFEATFYGRPPVPT